MSDSPTPTSGVPVAARWFVDPTSVPSPVNALLIQVGTPAGGSVDSLYLTFGHVNPPIVEAPPGAQITPEMVEGVVLPVTPVSRVVVSPDRLSEFRDQINQVLASLEGSGE